MLKLGFEPDSVTLGSLVKGFCGKNMANEAVYFVEKMGLCNSGRWSDAVRLLSEIIKKNISPNVITYSALVDAFVKNGKVLEAKEMIRMCIDPDVVTYSSLINGLCMQGRIDEAREMFDLMVSKGCFPDVVSYNTLINGFCKSMRAEDGMRLFREMSQRGLVSNTVTYNILIQGFFQAGDVDMAHEFFGQIDSFGVSPDIWTYNILLVGLCDNGELEKALVIFEDKQKREMDLDIVTYTIIIRGMCETGKVEDAWGLFWSLSVKGVKPDVVAYITIMSCLCRKGLHREIDELYTKMKGDGLMLNDGTLCLRDGDITVSAELIKEMLSHGYAPSGGGKKAVSLLRVCALLSSSEPAQSLALMNISRKQSLLFLTWVSFLHKFEMQNLPMQTTVEELKAKRDDLSRRVESEENKGLQRLAEVQV
ncbi:unnamed protein product [Brassica oleracea var. botrytis]